MENGKLDYEFISDKYTKNIEEFSKGPAMTLSDIMVKPSGCILPKIFVKYYEKLHNFEIYPDDTWVVSYPKAGTTWTQEMVWLLKNNVDFDKAKSTQITTRVPFLEHEAIVEGTYSTPGDIYRTIDTIAEMPRPRIIKSHLPADLLPKKVWTVKPKIVYVCRQPRDVAVSLFHHYRLWSNYQGTLDDIIDAFLHDRCMYSPYWGHVLGFYDLKENGHILFNTYEEMINDLGGVIRKTAQFLDVEVTDEQVDKMKDHLSFKNMKNNAKVNYTELLDPLVKNYGNDVKKEELKFIRKGKSGGWKEEITQDSLEKFEKWNEHHLKGRSFKDYPW